METITLCRWGRGAKKKKKVWCHQCYLSLGLKTTHFWEASLQTGGVKSVLEMWSFLYVGLKLRLFTSAASFFSIIALNLSHDHLWKLILKSEVSSQSEDWKTKTDTVLDKWRLACWFFLTKQSKCFHLICFKAFSSWYTEHCTTVEIVNFYFSFLWREKCLTCSSGA